MQQRKMLDMFIRYFCLSAVCLVFWGCQPPTTGVSVTGYNHMDGIPIYAFSVNGGAGGGNLEGGGGGSQSCCIVIPNRWRPGLKAKIVWEYDTYQNDPAPPLPSQSIEVDVPEYTKPGVFQVHFYSGHKVKVVVSSCRPGHAFYPMSKEDLLPWAPRATQEETKAAAKGGWKNEC